MRRRHTAQTRVVPTYIHIIIIKRDGKKSFIVIIIILQSSSLYNAAADVYGIMN